MGRISISANELNIEIEGISEKHFGEDLYTRAIVHLISEADTHGWEKASIEYGGDPDSLGAFCATVLTALARLYKSELDLYAPESESETVQTVLSKMIDHLTESGRLTTVIG